MLPSGYRGMDAGKQADRSICRCRPSDPRVIFTTDLAQELVMAAVGTPRAPHAGRSLWSVVRERHRDVSERGCEKHEGCEGITLYTECDATGPSSLRARPQVSKRRSTQTTAARGLQCSGCSRAGRNLARPLRGAKRSPRNGSYCSMYWRAGPRLSTARTSGFGRPIQAHDGLRWVGPCCSATSVDGQVCCGQRSYAGRRTVALSGRRRRKLSSATSSRSGTAGIG